MKYLDFVEEIFNDLNISKKNIQIQELAYHVQTEYKKRGVIIDLGGGYSLKSAALSRLGMEVYIIDLFDAYWLNSPSGLHDVKKYLEFLKINGVTLMEHNLFDISWVDSFKENSVDIISAHHVLEHFHDSPKKILEGSLRLLKPGGKLIIEVPNAANLRKRFNLLRGKTNYPDYNSFYSIEKWNGHIREYVYDDLRTLANNLKCSEYKISGKNYYGSWLSNVNPLFRNIGDKILTKFPSLCGSLYLEIIKNDSKSIVK